MRNIYQDDFSGEESQDIFSNSSDTNQTPAPSPAPSRPVRPARQAPPPIKKAVISERQNAEAQPQPFSQPGFYPQGVFIQQSPSQPYPVYYAPIPAVPFAPAPQAAPQPAPSQPTRADSAAANEAGTRVLYQSDDFNIREEDIEQPAHTSPSHTSYAGFDVSEISLPSGKRAPSPTRKKSFAVDEMEIGTYELDIMTVGRGATARNVLTPDEESRRRELSEESYLDELYEDYPEDEQEEAAEEESVEAEAEAEDTPKKKKPVKKALPTGEIIRRAVLGVSVLAIIIASASLINEYRLHLQNKKLMNDLSNMIITQPSTENVEQSPDSEGKKPGTSIPTTLPLAERPLSIEEQWEILREENPDVVFPENMQLKYAKLYAQNTDFVGYLHAEGSELDSPIVQGEDDEEYVEKNFNGEYTKYACPFVTHTNTIEKLDSNTVIFGHHMRDGSIFGTLDQYRTLEGYKKSPVISFNTIYQDYDFKVIATMITNINPKHDNDYVFTYYWTNLNNELNHTAYLNQLSQRSLYDTGVDVLPTDKLLTLSTCCKDFDDARLVVVARLVRPGESTEVDTSLAVENENPRFPQAYYDEKGIKNPYAEAYKWQIS